MTQEQPQDETNVKFDGGGDDVDPKPGPAKEPAHLTSYVVLERDTSGGGHERWAVVGEVESHSAEGARRKTFEQSKDEDPEMTLVAVPKRSWTPTPYKYETKKKVVSG